MTINNTQVIERTLRSEGLQQYTIDGQAGLIKRVSDALDAAPNGSVRDTVQVALHDYRGHGYDRYITAVITAVESARASEPAAAATSSQDAPAAEGSVDRSEYADRLRVIAERMGLPTDQVEDALIEAGLVDEEDEEEDAPTAASPAVSEALDALSGAVQALRNALS